MKTSYSNITAFLKAFNLEAQDFTINEYEGTRYARTWLRHQGEVFCVTFPEDIDKSKRLVLNMEERSGSKGDFVAVFGYNPREERETWSL